MICFPNAKINLGLSIVGKRADGFHNIASVFYPVPCSEALEILPAPITEFKSEGIAIPGDASNNLCMKAYKLLANDFALPPLQLILLKTLPIGAGMGGGSADAAFALKAINELVGLQLSNDTLIKYAQQLGSDCAFFVENKPVFCYNKGDEFEPIELSLKGYWVYLVYPNLAISTALAYSGVVPKEPTESIKKIISEPIDTWKNRLKNDFEDSLFPQFPVLEEIKNKLYANGAMYASITGSGSTLYGIFKEKPETIAFPMEYWTYQGELN
jgi:4-diphosphocytidyl-2-C-methyl-D-erythritol kinase